MTSTAAAVMTWQNPATQHDPEMLRSVRHRNSVPGPTASSWPRSALALGKELAVAICHSALQLLSSRCHWVEGAGGVLLHQLAVFTLGRGEKKPGCERKRRGEGRKANELPPGFLLCAGWFTCCIAGRALSKCQRRVGPHV